MSDRCPPNVSPTVITHPTVISKPTFPAIHKPIHNLSMGFDQLKLPKKKEIVLQPISARLKVEEVKVIDNKIDSADSVVADSLEPHLTKSDEESPIVVIGSTNGSTSGYGSEGYVSEEERKLKVETLNVLDIRDEHTHCARCHKTFDPLSGSNAEKRCLLPHPTKMVIPIRRDGDGTHFVCLCCRTEFKLPKMTFYEAGVNSMLTGYCFIGQHTSDEDDIDYQYDGGAALSCEEAGCIEFFV